MNYGDPTLRDRLAADYVSGAMRGGARRRFEGLMAADANLRRQVRQWEEQVYPLVWAIPPRNPPRRVWRAIQGRLRAAAPVSPWGWQGANLWRLFSGALAALLIAGVIVYPGQVDRAAQQQLMAVLQSPEAQAMLLVKADADGSVHVRTLRDLAPYATNRALELWAIPPGQKPQSLGLLSAEGATTLKRAQGLAGVAQLAVTVEPPGGAPGGVATGPIIMSGDVLKI
ncbi:anti-sigma factor domain-containing protein [Bordetella genomosp. 13]|uniref:anti-sigma factor n=1 Tax=Bordetella genomosp. 13 TaxID=463040 RepID=UPI0011A34ACB|nr:anti-sigma factor [Bordetella genomosp. 13]